MGSQPRGLLALGTWSGISTVVGAISGAKLEWAEGCGVRVRLCWDVVGGGTVEVRNVRMVRMGGQGKISKKGEQCQMKAYAI